MDFRIIKTETHKLRNVKLHHINVVIDANATSFRRCVSAETQGVCKIVYVSEITDPIMFPPTPTPPPPHTLRRVFDSDNVYQVYR